MLKLSSIGRQVTRRIWSCGDRLPDEYRLDRYVVSDWQSHKLGKSQYGYHWVRADNRYVLASISTGVIADIFLGQ
jgi:Ni/Co efflux regulator RcnB